jgi:hypothetical protein
MSNLSDRDNSRDRVSRDGFALMTVQGITTINPTGLAGLAGKSDASGL